MDILLNLFWFVVCLAPEQSVLSFSMQQSTSLSFAYCEYFNYSLKLYCKYGMQRFFFVSLKNPSYHLPSTPLGTHPDPNSMLKLHYDSACCMSGVSVCVHACVCLRPQLQVFTDDLKVSPDAMESIVRDVTQSGYFMQNFVGYFLRSSL